jgi:hypothetical protein
MLSTVLLAVMLGLPADDADANLVEALRDAQETHREAWSRGRARVRVTVTRPGGVRPCIIKADILWHGDSFILKPQVDDPDDVHFLQMVQFREEGNVIARGEGFVITYSALQNYLRDQDWAPHRVSVDSIFVLSPRARFANCCPPHSDPGRPWKDLIGPSPDLPDVFKTSTFTQRRLPNGDIEQTRHDEEGNKVITVFSARYDMAVTSTISYFPQGTLEERLEYTYTKQGDRRVLPAGCVAERFNRRTKTIDRYEYVYSDIVIPDTTPASEFTRPSVLARVRRETNYGKRRSRPRAKPTVDDATLESLSRELKEKGTAKP